MRKSLKTCLMSTALTCLVAVASPTNAALTLTAAGIADGFTLSQFYDDPGAYYGILGLAVTPGGTVVAAGYARNQFYTLPDVDGQTFATITTMAAAPGNPREVAAVGSTVYMTVNGAYNTINPGTFALTPLVTVPATSSSLGLWANPVTGHLISSSNRGLVDIDPATGAVIVIGPGGADGVTVSPDGTIAYGEFGGAIVGYSITTPNPGIPVYNSGTGIGHSPDGTGIISGSAFDGQIIVNNNDGTVGLLDPATNIETIIASGGSRGDYVAPDQTNGSLFLSTADSVWRLKIAGGTIGGGGTPAPEPASMALNGVGLVGLAAVRRRRA